MCVLYGQIMNQSHLGTRSLPGQEGLSPVLLVNPPYNIDHPAPDSILFSWQAGEFYIYLVCNFPESIALSIRCDFWRGERWQLYNYIVCVETRHVVSLKKFSILRQAKSYSFKLLTYSRKSENLVSWHSNKCFFSNRSIRH